MPLQGRKFCGILYVETESYNIKEVLNSVRCYFDQWAYCLHDRDVVDETGEAKKPHYHWVGSVKNPVSLATISNTLGVAPNYIQFVRKKGNGDNWKGAVRYLIHADHPQKFQYDAQEVVTNFDVIRYFNAYDDTQQIVKIVGFIHENPCCTFEEVFDFAVNNGCYSEFRRAAYIINRIMYERNVKNESYRYPEG